MHAHLYLLGGWVDGEWTCEGVVLAALQAVSRSHDSYLRESE